MVAKAETATPEVAAADDVGESGQGATPYAPPWSQDLRQELAGVREALAHLAARAEREKDAVQRRITALQAAIARLTQCITRLEKGAAKGETAATLAQPAPEPLIVASEEMGKEQKNNGQQPVRAEEQARRAYLEQRIADADFEAATRAWLCSLGFRIVQQLTERSASVFTKQNGFHLMYLTNIQATLARHGLNLRPEAEEKSDDGGQASGPTPLLAEPVLSASKSPELRGTVREHS